MNREDKLRHDLARIEESHRRAQKRIALQQERINQRFERIREKMNKKYGEPNDSQQRIIDAALDLLDRDGLNDLSLRKLAGVVNMQASALYWHFKSKDVLIDYMAEAILRSEFKDLQPMSPDEAWQDWLVNICKRLRRAMCSRRDGGRIVAGAHLFPAITLLRIFETTQESLIRAGVDPRKADLIATTAIHLTFGRVIEEQSSPGPEELVDMDFSEMKHWPEELMEMDFAAMQRSFPRIAESVIQTIKENKAGRDEFEASLRLIVGYAEKA